MTKSRWKLYDCPKLAALIHYIRSLSGISPIPMWNFGQIDHFRYDFYTYYHSRTNKKCSTLVSYDLWKSNYVCMALAGKTWARSNWALIIEKLFRFVILSMYLVGYLRLLKLGICRESSHAFESINLVWFVKFEILASEAINHLSFTYVLNGLI